MKMADNEEYADPVEKMLKQTGCINLHYKVQECIAEKKDWRQCQNEVKTFRACMDKYTSTKRKQEQLSKA